MKSGNVALSSSKGEVEEDVCWTRAEMEMERRQKQKDRKVLPEPEEGAAKKPVAIINFNSRFSLHIRGRCRICTFLEVLYDM